ncbi:MrcB family domain-containing protein, partial [Ruegeria arenilitoris]|uniref:MrcB family domain-containing protein n=1 Tax=Ruegeria arenilitoris TaxID=1173585 RepID=UPI00147988C9
MSIREIIQSVGSNWSDYKATKTTDSDNSTHQLVETQFPTCLEKIAGDSTHLIFSGSCGLGNVSAAPWVATFDSRITKSPQDGYYHHTGKDTSRGARGHSSLKGAVDAEISITRDGDIITA